MKPEAHHSIHVRSQARSCRIYGERSGKVTGFSPSTRFSTVTVYPQHLHIHILLIYR